MYFNYKFRYLQIINSHIYDKYKQCKLFYVLLSRLVYIFLTTKALSTQILLFTNGGALHHLLSFVHSPLIEVVFLIKLYILPNIYNIFLLEETLLKPALTIQELQRRLSCLSVAENSAQMVLKRDRLAFELRMVEGGIQVCTFTYKDVFSAWDPLLKGEGE